MFFQLVLEGIAGLTRSDADRTFLNGIHCNWWRRVRIINTAEIIEKLTERNLDWHLNHCDDLDPMAGNTPFHENAPFISATAGVVERDSFLLRNIVFDPRLEKLLDSGAQEKPEKSESDIWC